MEKSVIICDTNILIELYKSNQTIISILQKIGEENIAISSVTAGELIFGALNKKELQTIKKDIDNLVVLHINELISRKFIELMFKYSKSHGLAVPDALIASTALINNLEIYTLNKKDFRFIEGIKLYNY
jgi:predicted nucleic acid-binding protein